MSLYAKMAEQFRYHNPTDDMLRTVYGLNSHTEFDAIILAPSWNPQDVFVHDHPVITVMRDKSYYKGYEVRVRGKRYGYLQTSRSAGSMLDSCLLLGAATCKKYIFIGTAGALVDSIQVGDLVTPKCSIAGDGASLYLHPEIATKNFRAVIHQDRESIASIQRAATALRLSIAEKTVYTTDSIFCEYFHLEDILSMGCEGIEQETSAFMRCMELMGKQYAVLLCISDSSASSHSLIQKSDDAKAKLKLAKEKHIPDLIHLLSS